MGRSFRRRLSLFDFRPSFRVDSREVEKASQQAESRLGGAGVEVPPADLDELHQVFRREWQEVGRLDRLSSRVRRWFPHLLFYPFDSPDDWPAHDPKLRDAVRDHITDPRYSRALASLCHGFLRAFPLGTKPFELYADVCRQGLARSASLRCRTLHAASAKFKLFTPEGPRAVANYLVSAGDPVAALREATELSVVAPDSQFRYFLSLAILKAIQESLATGLHWSSNDIEACLAAIPGAIEKGNKFDPDLRKSLAEALLLPFADRAPLKGLKEWARPLVLGHLGDPRSRPVAWSNIDRRACEVMLRWLVEDTIDQFFHVLNRTAKDSHWNDRREFWMGYLNTQAIANAWVVLGPDARRYARRSLDDASVNYGQLRESKADQSVLLMQFGPSLVVAEWSHDGACHFWDDPAMAPTFFKKSYSGREMRQRSKTKVDHRSPDPARWQGQIASTIKSYSGIDHPGHRNGWLR